MTTIAVAPITPSDLEACTRLYVDVFNGDPWNDQWTYATAHKRLSDILITPGFVGFLATEVDTGSLIGLAMGNRERWYDGTDFFFLKEMCVRADRQRQGVGGQLLQALDEALRPSVSLTILLTGAGGETESFYTKHGFSASKGMIMMSRRPG